MTADEARLKYLWDQQLARRARNREAEARKATREKEALARRVEEHHKRRMRQIDHEITLKIRRQAAERRRAEEALSVQTCEFLMKTWRGPLFKGSGAIRVDTAQRWLRMRMERSGPPLEPFHSLFVNYTQARGRVVRWTSTPGVNAYCVGDGSLELWPIRTERSAAVAWHEEAHAQAPCRKQQPPHVRVKDVCVRCEISAWGLAAQIAMPEFTTEMHNEMAHCIRTYQQYGTPAEQREIDAMCKPAWFQNAPRKRRRRENA
jgi:hypothetical protein